MEAQTSVSLLIETWNARKLLTVLEEEEWAHVHRKTVYRLIKDGYSKPVADSKANG